MFCHVVTVHKWACMSLCMFWFMCMPGFVCVCVCVCVCTIMCYWLLCMFCLISSCSDSTLVSLTGFFFCWLPQLGNSILKQRKLTNDSTDWPLVSSCKKNPPPPKKKTNQKTKNKKQPKLTRYLLKFPLIQL